MKVVGTDFSTKRIDMVELDLDEDHAVWASHEMQGKVMEDRIRYMERVVDDFPVTALPDKHSLFWDDVIAVGLERPIGRFNAGPLNMMLGALLTRIPPDTLVKLWTPSAWKKQTLGKGNALKSDVQAWARSSTIRAYTWDAWSEDAFDALAIAWATRARLETVADPSPSVEQVGLFDV